MASPTQFRHYLIAQDAEGANIEVLRSSEQVAVFAFDSKRHVFVHCHVLLDPLTDRSTFESRARFLSERGHPLRARVLEYGEDDSSGFYITEHVDGETLRSYLERRETLPARLAAKIIFSTLLAAQSLLELGDFLSAQPLDDLRILQSGAQSLAVVVADFQVLPPGARSTASPDALVSQLQFLKVWCGEQMQRSTLMEEATVNSAEFLEHLAKTLAVCTPAGAAALGPAIAELEKQIPAAPEGELSASLKPRPYLANMLANFQELARSVSQTVRIQSQKLTPAQPYALRGMYMKTGQTVVVEQLPPRRLAGNFPSVCLRQVQNLPKGKYPNLVPVIFVEYGDDVECMGEAAVEGVALNDLLDARKTLDPQETYVVLASMDAALEQLEKSGVPTQRLRLEDIYLFTGFGKEAPVDSDLLATKLNEWPGFSIVVRTHPCMHSMVGRGTDTALLLPLPTPLKGGAEPLWNGGWMAALASFLSGMSDGRAGKHETGIPQTDSVLALLEDELQRATKGTPSPRPAFLARFARLVQKYELVQPKPSAPRAELSGVDAPQGAARDMAKPGIVLPPRKGGPPPPMPAQPAAPSEEGEAPALGFAEALIQKTSHSGDLDEDFEEDYALPPMRSAMRLRTSQVESSWMPVRPKRPFWMTAMMVLIAALIAAAAFAHFTGRAFWRQGEVTHLTPVSEKPVKAEVSGVIDLPTPPSSKETGKKAGTPTLPVPSKPMVKDLDSLPKASATPNATTPAALTPAKEVPMAIPVTVNPAMMDQLQLAQKNGAKLTADQRVAAEVAAQSGNATAMIAFGRALLRGEGGAADERGGFVWLEKASEAGEPGALVPLAECYLQGWGTAPDGAKATSLLQKASNGGNAAAKDLLGVCYARGIGVDRDDNRAIQLLGEAYSDGVTSACGNLGALYLRGQGVEPDAEKAVRFFSEGARRGHAESMMLYAQCLEYGTGVLTDREEAMRWYQQAAKLGNAEAVNWCREKVVTF
ncbi:MAG TPA: Sel1-like repeat-containing protein kinase family protein [Verrucomicrobium sp.]|nr:Sel1-like repeat-containing protein kinase family protein [Verrucomicrobium sp.]